jgi:hypothetical protein
MKALDELFKPIRSRKEILEEILNSYSKNNVAPPYEIIQEARKHGISVNPNWTDTCYD